MHSSDSTGISDLNDEEVAVELSVEVVNEDTIDKGVPLMRWPLMKSCQ